MAVEKGDIKVSGSVVNNVQTDFNEISNIENFISKILGEENFDKLNHLKNDKNITNRNKFNNEVNSSLEFISIDSNSIKPYLNLISEKEFFKIVGASKKGLKKTSGKYQESLYSHYIQALAENDEGYISDVLKKAMILRENINETEELMKNEVFRKKWKENFETMDPVYVLKNTGSMKRINVIRRSI